VTSSIPSDRFQRHGRHRSRPMMSEINVTPFVDVMLVLLVVFMITAPLLSVGVPVDLPETRADILPGADEPLAVTVDADGRVFVMETEVETEQLGPLLTEISGANAGIRIFIRGDASIDYGRVLEVMGEITSAGFTRVALVARPPSAGKGTAE
jgi:biopolymer transport protein TolR